MRGLMAVLTRNISALTGALAYSESKTTAPLFGTTQIPYLSTPFAFFIYKYPLESVKFNTLLYFKHTLFINYFIYEFDTS